MTLLDRLERLYAENPDHNGVCGYCQATLPDHDELCVWQTTRDAIIVLRQYREVVTLIEPRLPEAGVQ